MSDASVGTLGALSGLLANGAAGTLIENGLNLGSLRPIYDPVTGSSFNVIGDQKVMTNSPTSLRYDAWKILDEALIEEARQRLGLVADLTSSGLVYNNTAGLGKTILESENVGDVTDAEISMDPANANKSDAIEFDMVGLPLPVISKGFHYTARQIAVNQSSGTPLDTTHMRLAAQRVLEKMEKMAIGTETYKYGGYNIYGLINFPDRNTTTINDPSLTSGWNGKMFIDDILAMREAAKADWMYGPYSLYLGTSWDQYLDSDYSDSKGSNTIRERVLQLDNIQSVRTLDFLPGFRAVLVMKNQATVRMVNTINLQTIQWPEMAGLKVNFKVMASMVPQVRATQAGRCGIVDATAVDGS